MVISARVTKNEEVGSHAERTLRVFKTGYYLNHLICLMSSHVRSEI